MGFGPRKRKLRVLISLLFLVIAGYIITVQLHLFSKSNQEKRVPNSGKERDRLNHLIIVPCHGVWIGGGGSGKGDDDIEWSVPDYPGVKEAALEDIDSALIMHDLDVDSLLIFSGGMTQESLGPVSEGYSYYQLAIERSPDGRRTKRIGAEVKARDSYENIVYSICRFNQLTGNYPEKITVIGYAFKEKRFSELHRQAISFPQENFYYKKMQIDQTRPQDIDGEYQLAFLPFQNDPYGCIDPILKSKREKRNPFNLNVNGMVRDCPEMADLLEWCDLGGKVGRLYTGSLPWK